MLKRVVHLEGNDGIVTLKGRLRRLGIIGIFPFLVFGPLTGCSHGRVEKAAVETLNQAFKRDPLVLSLDIGRVSQQCAPIPGLVYTPELTNVIEYRAAQKAGLINITQAGPGFWKVELINPSPKLAAILAKARHIMKGGCDYQIIALTVASKSVVDLVSLQPITSEKSDVVFTWKWTLQPDGVKLVDKLSEQERLQLAPHIERVNPLLHQTTFNLGDMTASTTPHQDKVTLRKSGDDWVVDE